MAEIQFLTLEQTFPLRSQVLREGKTNGLTGPTDNLAETFHLGSVAGNGEVVGTSTYFPSPCTYEPDIADAYMLRYMAVSPAHQGEGIGASIIKRAIEVLHERGAKLLWANARDTALKFYLNNGFTEVAGSGFVHQPTGIPHTVVMRRIDT